MSLVSDILSNKTTELSCISVGDTVLQAAELMNRERIGAVCVLDNNRLVGIFTERDILCRVVAGKRDPASTKVSDVMTSPITTCGPNAKLSDCAAVMSHDRIRHLPVVQDGKPIGMVSTGDVMASDLAERQAHIEDLHQYLHGRT